MSTTFFLHSLTFIINIFNIKKRIKKMIKMRTSAVTGVTYGLLSALVIVAALGALTAVGVNIENIFSTTGNTIAATIVKPITLNSFQQQEVDNAASEIASGSMSASCLNYLANPANLAAMSKTGATCNKGGYDAQPPELPIHIIALNNNNTLLTVEANNVIYDEGISVSLGADSISFNIYGRNGYSYISKNPVLLSSYGGTPTSSSVFPIGGGYSSEQVSGVSIIPGSAGDVYPNASTSTPFGVYNGPG